MSPKLRIDREANLFVLTIWRLLHHRAGTAGLVILMLLVCVAVLAPFIAPYDPLKIDSQANLSPPSIRHIFGTDQFGRDLFSRVIYGTRISLTIALVSTVLGTLVGATSGLAAAYLGGIFSVVVMRFWDMLLAFPVIFLGIAIAAALGPGRMSALFAMSIAAMPTFARIAQAKALSVKEEDYILAARSIGAPDKGIIFRHLLPNCMGPILVQMAVSTSVAVLMVASLSFLGIGIQPPEPDWGGMLKQSLSYLRLAWWYGFYPGLFLSILVLGLNLLADALRDCLDPTFVQRI